MFMTFLRGFSVPCLMLGLLFFSASLTPTMLPRGPEVQGVLGGIVTALGYLLGRSLQLLWHAADMPRLSARLLRLLTLSMSLIALPTFAWALISGLGWQNDLRGKMGMQVADSGHILLILLTAAGTLVAVFAIGLFVALLFKLIRAQFYRFMPPRRANILGVLVAALIVFVVTRDGILDRMMTSLDDSYEKAQFLFEDAPPPPQSAETTGSGSSLVNWSAIGEPGRDFITSGPDADAISAFTGKPAIDPIRVYVGRANAETETQRAQIALAELIRLGAFNRKVLIVTSPTGTGWMDPGAHDPLEYMHNGDIATVSAQYSYLQSPLALVFETNSGLDQAVALLETVHKYWKTLPDDQRPRLYVHGLSLGAWSSMYATNLFRLVDDPIDGAFWAGPPFPSRFWNYVQNARNPASPWVLPEIEDGSLVRYASHFVDPTNAPADWGRMRIVFLQYSSDPVVFYDPWSLFRRPEWMRDPPAPDASEHMRFLPIVTQFQLALDMALSFSAPPGHGHAYYSEDYISPWVEVTAPEGWTAADTERLKLHCNLGVGLGCRN
jgi:uncharacterized membrane protein